MKILNTTASMVLSKMVGMMSDGYIKIDNSEGSFMPVITEEIFYTNKFKIYSMAHYYEQNGDLMADPEMCFIHDLKENVFIPSYFKQDGFIGREQESAFLVDDDVKVNDIRLQSDHTRFANIWLRNIKQQQKI